MNRRLVLALVGSLLTSLPASAEPPATRPAEAEAVPPWERPDNALPPLTGDDDFLAKLVPQHAENWRKYERLEMTPVDDAPAFRAALSAALRREIEYLPDVPRDAAGEVVRPIPAKPAAAPQGPMTEHLYERLTDAVLDQLLAMQDRPFAFQRGRFFKNRRFLLKFPDAEYDATADVREVAKTLDADPEAAASGRQADGWQLIEKAYEQRRTAAGGGYCVTSAALASPRGLRAAVYEPADAGDVGRIFFRFTPEQSRYWFGGLQACGLRLTWSPVSAAEVSKRDGKLLRCDVRLVLETKNGDRLPISLEAYFDPKDGDGGRWEIESCCFMSSPYAAAVGWVR